ncbi:hypothetical protein [Pseudonocardia kongjuensis]|uniref:hypothetical protein n=1 Tax=Pseudonocardia kongjuensis TaxID=102227 RepID=UPI0031DDA43D
MAERRRAAAWQARANQAGGRTTRALDQEIAALLAEDPDPAGPAGPDPAPGGPAPGGPADRAPSGPADPDPAGPVGSAGPEDPDPAR